MMGITHCVLSSCFNHHSDLNVTEIKASEEIKLGKYPLRGPVESSVSIAVILCVFCYRIFPHPQSVVTTEVICKVISMHTAPFDIYSKPPAKTTKCFTS